MYILFLLLLPAMVKLIDVSDFIDKGFDPVVVAETTCFLEMTGQGSLQEVEDKNADKALHKLLKLLHLEALEPLLAKLTHKLFFYLNHFKEKMETIDGNGLGYVIRYYKDDKTSPEIQNANIEAQDLVDRLRDKARQNVHAGNGLSSLIYKLKSKVWGTINFVDKHTGGLVKKTIHLTKETADKIKKAMNCFKNLSSVYSYVFDVLRIFIEDCLSELHGIYDKYKYGIDSHNINVWKLTKDALNKCLSPNQLISDVYKAGLEKFQVAKGCVVESVDSVKDTVNVIVDDKS